MADIGTKISELEAAAALDGTELLVAVQGGRTKKSTAAAVETLVKTGLTASDVGLGNVANVLQYSAQNPPPTPTPAEIGAVPVTRTVNGKALSADISLTASDVDAIPTSQKGAASGVAELDSGGKVPSSQLPSYVDDVLEYASISAFPATGESGKIYVAIDTGRTYRWSGSTYIEISNPVIIDDTLSVEGEAADAAAVGEALDTMDDAIENELAGKANIDGAYENMTVGNAEQLVSTVMVNDKVPYLFRTSGGSADIGNREYDTLVGGSVAWNQLCVNGNFSNGTNSWVSSRGNIAVSDGVLTYTVTEVGSFFGANRVTQSIKYQSHKYLFTTTLRCSKEYRYVNRIIYNNGELAGNHAEVTLTPNTWTTVDSIISSTHTVESGETQYGIWLALLPSSDAVVGDTVEFSNVMFIDLTQMFGSTIADYIYGLEQANAGAGVAWFKSLFPKPYYANNAGELLSVSGVSAHQMTGFNQWDEEWENGRLESATGGDVPNSSFFRSKNYIPCFPDTAYYATLGTYPSTNARMAFYDADKQYIGQTNGWKVFGGSVTTPSNAYYMRFTVNSNDYTSGICINLSWSGYRNGEYEPYVLHSYPLDSDLTLRGVPQLDADHNLYYDGDTYEADGTVTRKYGYVDLGTLSYNYNSAYGFQSANALDNIKPTADADGVAVAISANRIVTSYNNLYAAGTSGNYIAVLLNGKVSVNSTETIEANFKASMSGVYLVYELATPTTETADAFQSPQIVDDFGTERYVVTAQSGVEVPVGHSTDYPANLRDKLQHLPDLAESNGTYLIQQTDSDMALTPYTAPRGVPDAPTTDGTYVLKATVADGTATYSWVAE